MGAVEANDFRNAFLEANKDTICEEINSKCEELGAKGEARYFYSRPFNDVIINKLIKDYGYRVEKRGADKLEGLMIYWEGAK